MNLIKVYTDGACSGNPGPGGFAALILLKNEEIKISGGEKQTTNNRMEMTALLESLKKVQQILKDTDNDFKIEYYIDSEYVLKGATVWMDGWKKKNWKASTGAVKNRDLWEQIDQYLKGLNIKWTWVRGHNGDKYNEIVDEMAVAEVEKVKSK